MDLDIKGYKQISPGASTDTMMGMKWLQASMTSLRLLIARRLGWVIIGLIVIIGLQLYADKMYLENNWKSIIKLRNRAFQWVNGSSSYIEADKPEPEFILRWSSNQSEDCRPLEKIAFAKTHKTGSSTLQNIFFRYGHLNGLYFAMPPKSWMFSFKEPFQAPMVYMYPLQTYDIFMWHSIWNYDEVKKILPTALYITLLRDPVDCFESNYVYMGLQKAHKMDLNQYVEKKLDLERPRSKNSVIDKNQELWDLGMPPADMEDMDLVEEKIAKLDSEFHFVLIAEHFDESLVILARLLCWDLESMRYLPQNVRKDSMRTEITNTTRESLKKWLKADYLLYNHFKDKFEEARKKYGEEDLIQDVERLQALNDQLRVDCVKEVADNTKLKGEFRMALSIVEGYIIDTNKPWCTGYARSEPQYASLVRKKQKARPQFGQENIKKLLKQPDVSEARRKALREKYLSQVNKGQK